MQRDRRAVIIYSGGMDSFTLLHQLLASGYELHALSFDYGQRHRKELDFAAAECARLGITHKVIGMQEIGAQLLQGSSLTSPGMEVPLGHYAEESMKATVVPNRNMVMLALATGYAVSIGAREVYTAVHAGDHAIYPDCRPAFIAAMNQVTEIANYQPVTIQAPYLNVDKAGILAEGLELDLDYARSWTCYNGRDKACGKCGSCTERLEAFTRNNETDPLEYET
jgi:7-cyano-7-deazaguanine synthase